MCEFKDNCPLVPLNRCIDLDGRDKFACYKYWELLIPNSETQERIIEEWR